MYQWPDNVMTPFCYVAGSWPEQGFVGHPLANPFPRTDPEWLHKYLHWFDSQPNLTDLLHEVRADSECGRLPLACWCGFWSQGQKSIPCHAVLIAKRMAEMFPQDLIRMDW